MTEGTIYFFRIPEAEQSIEIHGVDPYTLTHTFNRPGQDRDVTFYLRMTVSNEIGESDHSNEVDKICQ